MATSGQLGNSTAVIEPARSAQHPVTLWLFNTGGGNNTVTVQLTQSSAAGGDGNLHTLYSPVLQTGEQAVISGIQLGPNDTLSAFATNATQVNYAVTPLPPNYAGRPQVTTFDVNGNAKTTVAGTAVALSGATTLTVTNANAFVVGQNGNTNPAFRVNDNTASSVTGVLITSNAAGSGVALAATTSVGQVNDNLTIDAAGTGTIGLNSVGGTGNVVLGDAVNLQLQTTTGTKVGTSTLQKLAFWNTAPIVQPTNATDLYNVLVNTGLIASGGTPPFSPPGTVNVADNQNVVFGTTNGSKIGTATTQKLAFFNSAPIVQPANTVDVFTGLVNLGLRASGGTATFSPPGNIVMADTANVVLTTTTGTIIGTATTQKLGFYNATPVVQPGTSANQTTGAAGTSTGVSLDTTFKGSSGSTTYTIGGIVTALKSLGLIAA